MTIQTVVVNACTPQTIVIGRRATYDTLQVVFDLSYLAETYGSGAAVLVVKRSQDTTAYPATITQDGNTLTWTISETDTYYVGAGECELMWYVNNGLAKTIIYPVVVMRDILQTAEEPPDAYENWVEALTALGAETQQHALDAAQSATEAETAQGKAEDAQAAAEAAKEAAAEAAGRAESAIVHAPIIHVGYWYIWNDGQYVNTNVRAEGEKGDKGDTGEKGDTGNGIASITKTGTAGLVDTYTVTYTDGTTTTFTVTNGAKGDKGDTGATGNGIASIAKTGTSGNVDTYTITYTNGQTTTFTVTNGAVSSVAGKTGAVTLDAGDVSFDDAQTYQSGTVGSELSDQKNAITLNTETLSDLITDVVITPASSNLLDLSKNVSGYVNGIGGINENSSYSTSDFIPVTSGLVYTAQGTDDTRKIRTINYIAGYDVDKNFVTDSRESYVTSYTPADGVAYIRFSLDAVYMDALRYPAFVQSSTVIPYENYTEAVTESKINASYLFEPVKNGAVWHFDINSNNFIPDTVYQTMCAYCLNFIGEITTFNELSIGKGYFENYGATLKIDTTNIYVYEASNQTPIFTEAHGLTFSDYIGIKITQKYGNVAEIIVYTNGGSYTKPYVGWDARKGQFFARSNGTNVLTNCTLGYYCYGLEKPTYIYGDSYLTNAAGVTDRWTSYLIAGNYTNYMLNGYPGRGSEIAFEALKNDLKLGKPERIIWAVGMNDGDTSSAINSTWETVVEELIQVCTDYGIELVLATIPNVETVNNSFKNEYVKNSGYRYIDFANAVGATNDTTWYTDMLSSDGVHPAVQGAIALYMQAISDVPELIS